MWTIKKPGGGTRGGTGTGPGPRRRHPAPIGYGFIIAGLCKFACAVALCTAAILVLQPPAFWALRWAWNHVMPHYAAWQQFWGVWP